MGHGVSLLIFLPSMVPTGKTGSSQLQQGF